jgi:ATP-dependent DNA helicase DinG
MNNFPFQALRERQSYVLNEIATGFASGYKYIVLEAPTGFGKSPVAIAVALTLGTSYICTSTKDLQAQAPQTVVYLMESHHHERLKMVFGDKYNAMKRHIKK